MFAVVGLEKVTVPGPDSIVHWLVVDPDGRQAVVGHPTRSGSPWSGWDGLVGPGVHYRRLVSGPSTVVYSMCRDAAMAAPLSNASAVPSPYRLS